MSEAIMEGIEKPVIKTEKNSRGIAVGKFQKLKGTRGTKKENIAKLIAYLAAKTVANDL